MIGLLSRLRLAADDPFRDADVRLLFGAQAVSILGSQVSHIAFPLIAVDVIQASNGSIVLLEAAFLMPFVLLSLPVGALLDRRGPRSFSLKRRRGHGHVRLKVVEQAGVQRGLVVDLQSTHAESIHSCANICD